MVRLSSHGSENAPLLSQQLNNFDQFCTILYGGFHKCRYPKMDRLLIIENPMKRDDLGYPHFRKPPCESRYLGRKYLVAHLGGTVL